MDGCKKIVDHLTAKGYTPYDPQGPQEICDAIDRYGSGRYNAGYNAGYSAGYDDGKEDGEASGGGDDPTTQWELCAAWCKKTLKRGSGPNFQVLPSFALSDYFNYNSTNDALVCKKNGFYTIALTYVTPSYPSGSGISTTRAVRMYQSGIQIINNGANQSIRWTNVSVKINNPNLSTNGNTIYPLKDCGSPAPTKMNCITKYFKEGDIITLSTIDAAANQTIGPNNIKIGSSYAPSPGVLIWYGTKEY